MRRSAFVSMLALAALPGCRAETATVAAPATDRPAGTIVVASDGNRLTAIDMATGQRTSRRVRSIPACGSELFVTGGHGVVKGLTTVFSMPVSLDGAPVRLGTTHALVTSATDGRVARRHGLRPSGADRRPRGLGRRRGDVRGRALRSGCRGRCSRSRPADRGLQSLLWTDGSSFSG